MTAKAIIERAQLKLIDETGDTWTAEELLEDFNAAQRDVVSLKPEAGTVVDAIELQAGARQKLPKRGRYLIEVIRNDESGRAITRAERSIMDRFMPSWASEEPSEDAEHYLYDDREQDTFYLYPPRPEEEPGKVLASYVATPKPLTDNQQPPSIAEGYEEALFYGVMARALAKDTGQADFQKSLQYQQLMQGVLLGKLESKNMMHPLQTERRAIQQ